MPRPDPAHNEATVSFGDKGLVMKVYWPNNFRTSDSSIVSTARSLVNKHQLDLSKILPVVYHSYDYEGNETSRIQESVNLPIRTVSEIVTGCACRVLLIERLGLQNTMTLQPRPFMFA